jgi:hypothetical protein
MIAELRERLAVSKQPAQNWGEERFSVEKLSDLEVRKEYY